MSERAVEEVRRRWAQIEIVPKKRAGGESLLEGALAALALALTSTGAPWMIIGGIAVIAHGVRRFTTDIDAAVRGDAISVDRLSLSRMVDVRASRHRSG